MASLAVHDKAASDDAFIKFLPVINRESTDERNFVKKAVNWALRQIGKRNRNLNRQAIETAREIQELDSKSARWIAADALRELTNDTVQSRMRSRCFITLNIDLETQQPHHTEKDSSPCPLPVGEGQTDMPINRHNQGEVALHPQPRF